MSVDHTVLVVCWLAVSKNKEIQVFREPQTLGMVMLQRKGSRMGWTDIFSLMPLSPQFLFCFVVVVTIIVLL